MKIKTKIRQFACVSTIIGLSSLSGPVTIASSVAANPIVSETITAAANNNTGTLRQGIPTRRLGGGTRGESIFVQEYTYLTALVMPDGMSVTTAERPTLLFYVPEMSANQIGEFVLRNGDDALVYENTFEIDQAGGTISIDLTELEELPALNIEENYQWYFSIVPDATDRSHDIVVQGGIRRVDGDSWLSQNSENTRLAHTSLAQLNRETPLQKAQAYQIANLWHDAAVTINDLRQAYPTDSEIASEWNQLIEMAGLGNVVETSEPTMQHAIQ